MFAGLRLITWLFDYSYGDLDNYATGFGGPYFF
jgi:hypothetical protein